MQLEGDYRGLPFQYVDIWNEVFFYGRDEFRVRSGIEEGSQAAQRERKLRGRTSSQSVYYATYTMYRL